MKTGIESVVDQFEEDVATLWCEMHRTGDRRFLEEIEVVSDECFDSRRAPLHEVVRRSHELFERVHAEYTVEIQKRLGHRLVRCPHCKGKE